MNFWISLVFTRLSDNYSEPKGVFVSEDSHGLPAITVFKGVAQGAVGATYRSSDIADREYRIIQKYLTESDGSWFTSHLDKFRSTGNLDEVKIAKDFLTKFGFPLLPYQNSEFPIEFRERSSSKTAEQGAAANP